ncbi:uncharacterized protein CTRU02_204824 [Colletotrichum truncatum]|uniref:Uncharacterized protein n=1 Tax=Colletotrichum truncatum TaxID=5467 RepID=A0ACC3ZD77_COLTU
MYCISDLDHYIVNAELCLDHPIPFNHLFHFFHLFGISIVNDRTAKLHSISYFGWCLDTENVAVYSNLAETQNFNVSPQAISFPGFSGGSVLLSIFALDNAGNPIIKSFQLALGSVSMPVLVLGVDGNPVSGASITANATTYPGVGQSCITDNQGQCTFKNLPSTTIGLVARAGDNSIAVNGLAASSGLVTLRLMPYVDPDADASFDIDNGTSGWSGGITKITKVKRDAQLSVSTNGRYNLQSAAKSFPVRPFTTNAYIKYKFITSEVPGGYFGSQYNDYYSITIRSNTGAFVTVTNSMNALGLGAFDSSGATDWFTLSLPVPSNTDSSSLRKWETCSAKTVATVALAQQILCVSHPAQIRR